MLRRIGASGLLFRNVKGRTLGAPGARALTPQWPRWRPPAAPGRDLSTKITASAPDGIDINIETDLDHPIALSSRHTQHYVPNLPPLASLNASAHHHDLVSFVAHSRRVGLSTASTTYRGTYYEYLAIDVLRRYGFELVRVGGRGDEGVDLVGLWHIPGHGLKVLEEGGVRSEGQPLRVIVQCKRFTGKSRLGPSLVRELEGAMRGASMPVGWRGPSVLGILLGPRAATKGMREAMAGSRRAMGWVLLEAPEQDDPDGTAEQRGMRVEVAEKERADPPDGTVRQILWNAAASQLGLEGLGVGIRYGQDGASGGAGDEMDTEAALLWKGRGYVVPNDSKAEVA